MYSTNERLWDFLQEDFIVYLVTYKENGSKASGSTKAGFFSSHFESKRKAKLV